MPTFKIFCYVLEVIVHTCIASLVSLACSTDFSFLWLSGAGLSAGGAGTWFPSGREWFAAWLLPDAGRVTSSSPTVTAPRYYNTRGMGLIGLSCFEACCRQLKCWPRPLCQEWYSEETRDGDINVLFLGSASPRGRSRKQVSTKRFTERSSDRLYLYMR